jgi:hypothetical protein
LGAPIQLPDATVPVPPEQPVTFSVPLEPGEVPVHVIAWIGWPTAVPRYTVKVPEGSGSAAWVTDGVKLIVETGSVSLALVVPSMK